MEKTMQETVDEIVAKGELAMMKNPENWPVWPFLPVKKRSKNPGQWPECGVLCEFKLDDPVKPIVYNHFVGGRETFDKQKILAQYDTFEDMMADGWVVD